MDDVAIAWDYVQYCAAGASAFPDCVPVWELGAIGVFLIAAIGIFLDLVATRLREGSGLASG